MRRSDWKVGSYGIRPNGKPTHCFYCDMPRGGQHAKGCVIRNRTVVVTLAFEVTVDVPEDWDADQIGFHFAGSSRCSNANVDLLQRLKEQTRSCLCSQSDATFVREATLSDEARDGAHVDQLPS